MKGRWTRNPSVLSTHLSNLQENQEARCYIDEAEPLKQTEERNRRENEPSKKEHWMTWNIRDSAPTLPQILQTLEAAKCVSRTVKPGVG